MYDIKWIREHPEAFKRGLTRRGLSSDAIYDELIALDESRRSTITKVQQWQQDRNRISAEIGAAKKAGDHALAAELMERVSRIKGDITRAGEKVAESSSGDLEKRLAEIPNTPLDDVPDGKDEHANKKKSEFGEKREYKDKNGKPFTPKQHFELGEALGMMDFELAAKLSGARFVVLQKGLARLERALGQFMLDLHTGPIRKSGNVDIGGYTEVNPPLLVSDEVMFGTAQLPKFFEDQFAAFPASILEPQEYDDNGRPETKYYEMSRAIGDPDRYWLIPTAEVPLTNLVRESIVDEDKLPMRLTACTPCFRAEAGAAGKDTRGMIRQHQFTKVELVSIVTPEKSKEEHERMLACAEEVLKKLELHYRVVTLCTGDMGFAAQKTYDIEVWLPGQGAYREISSCSNCGEFQARRMNARYRGKDGVRPVHTLNGSGVAVGRALIAVMETYQDDQGAIVVPAALKPYMGGLSKIERIGSSK
jgi:seryl-tRNA synthetase